MFVADLVVYMPQDFNQARHAISGLLVVAVEYLVVGRQPDKRKPPPKGVIHQSNRAISRVHRPDDANVWGYAEGISSCQGYFLGTVFQQIHQLTENTRQFRTIDLINHQDTCRVATTGLIAKFKKSALHHWIAQAAVRSGSGS